MKTYARVQDGVVMEIIPPETYSEDSPVGAELEFKSGDEIPISARYNSALIDGSISTMVDITNLTPQPEQGWTTEDGKTFLPLSTTSATT